MMGFDTFQIGDRSFCLVRGSDVERDGMYLELEDCGATASPLAEVFYSDTAHTFSTTIYDPATPDAAVRWLEEQARQLLR
jgi:hypothetical protein